MNARTTGIGIVAALALALPAAPAAAEEAGSVVPPENSAATQYTEALPTAGGDKQTGDGGKKPSPAKVLGAHNAHQLESQGKQGREVAEVVAETAPETSAPVDETPTEEADRAPAGAGQATGGGGGGGQATQGNAHGKPKPAPRGETPASPPQAPSSAAPSGSSGLGEVLAAATGSSSSGGLGLLLPVAILAAIAWSLAYLWQQRRPAD